MAEVKKQPHGGEIHLLQPGETANPNGRPKRIFSTLADEFKEQGFESATPSRVREVYEMLLGLPLTNIIEIAGSPKDEDNQYPSLVRIVAAEMIGKRRFEMVQEMLNRVYGRPKQAVDVTSGGERVGPFQGFDFLKPLAIPPDAGTAKKDG